MTTYDPNLAEVDREEPGLQNARADADAGETAAAPAARWFSRPSPTRLLQRVLRRSAMGSNRFVGLWRRLGRPTLEEWTEYLRRHGGFVAMGRDCSVNPSTYFGGPNLIRIGNNVRIAGAWFNTHDGVVNMINAARGMRLDSVGPIDIGDNVFVGYGSIVLPNVRIGPNSVIAAGSVVTRDVPANTVVGGIPAKPICSFDRLVETLTARTRSYPWRDLIERRDGGFDSAMEPELGRQRVAHFFPEDAQGGPEMPSAVAAE